MSKGTKNSFKERVINKVVKFLEQRSGNYFKQKNIFRALDLPEEKYVDFKDVLKDMAKQGLVERGGGSSYRFVERESRIQGIISFSTKGFSFVTTESGKEIFISANDFYTALHHDRVWVEKYNKKSGERTEGKVVKIANRSDENIYGILKKESFGWVAVPESPAPPVKFFIKDSDEKLEEGQLAELTNIVWQHPSNYPQAKVCSLLGSPLKPENDLKIVKNMYGLKEKFPPEVQKEIEELTAPKISEAVEDRLDFRDNITFTIDPESAKDFDDAVSLDKSENGNWLLGVHIADVTHYVEDGSQIDQEALDRGTSVYLGDSVIPMLPEKLSNELCSLVPKEDRLAFSILIELAQTGRVVDFVITPSIIRSRKRFSYEEAQDILDKGEGKYHDKLKAMLELSKILRKRRKKYGSIDFDIPEPIFELDEKGFPREVRRSERRQTNRLIEEFMLMANKCVARRIAVHRKSEDLPFIYRVHESPNREKIIGLYDILNKLGINYKRPKEFTSSDLAEILEEIQDSPFREFIEQVALRSMEKAVYTEEPKGHFGLGFQHYTHFTSPIRRYPDLMIHRLLKEYLQDSDKIDKEKYKDQIPAIAEKSTDMEINAMEAEREFIKIKQIRFISTKIGQIYTGVITGVIEAGLFVEISKFLIEGMVPVRKMNDDYYIFDEENHCMEGRHTGKIFRLGDIVKIKVERVSLMDREIDFELID